jgi:hypothetical protein
VSPLSTPGDQHRVWHAFNSPFKLRVSNFDVSVIGLYAKWDAKLLADKMSAFTLNPKLMMIMQKLMEPKHFIFILCFSKCLMMLRNLEDLAFQA